MIGDDDGDARSITGGGDDLQVIQEMARAALESNEALSSRNCEGVVLGSAVSSGVLHGALVCD